MQIIKDFADQITAVGPPEGSATDIEADMATQLLRIANARPMREKSENVLPSSYFCLLL